jgi:hypothetical protein
MDGFSNLAAAVGPEPHPRPDVFGSMVAFGHKRRRSGAS